ncbi:single-stranded DNA-binding protein [Leuconostoc falkenbergense]|uniref:Single-stranded DNA-binding protein n=1 Tax=Leuconostoc falkenbergense TaxID=2766470 RepID=A0A9X3IQD8_9LACO|nr:single-stranded DNA-binding protein [Leuconostoc falkenbergense]MCX7579412.1 single-stranded DNA-binding protein [Leuconostoc falkenbergense]
MNQVNLTGRLSRDVELRYTQSGKAVGTGSIAVTRKFKSANGERETDFINFTMWGKTVENFANFTHKGSQVGLSGSWQVRNYENKDGQRVYVNELVADNFDLLESKSQSQNQTAQPQNNKAQQTGFNPFNGTSNTEISDEDLPF